MRFLQRLRRVEIYAGSAIVTNVDGNVWQPRNVWQPAAVNIIVTEWLRNINNKERQFLL